MVGRPVLLRVEKTAATPGNPVLRVERLSVRGPRGSPALRDVSFTVRAQEIVGIAGVVGNGQSELFEVIAGLRRADSGNVTLGGLAILHSSVAQRYAAGLAHVPEDRHERGLVLDFTVAENAVLGRQQQFSRLLALDWPRVNVEARRLIATADVRPADGQARARSLSGGNQQKLVIARELARERATLLLAAQPTRGVDIGAIELIHRQLVAARDAGIGILLVSAELAELAALADRLLVMYRGRVVAELSAAELHADGGIERVGELMTGASVDNRRHQTAGEGVR
jgi:simple sugar transport system ATP-binding protein